MTKCKSKPQLSVSASQFIGDGAATSGAEQPKPCSPRRVTILGYFFVILLSAALLGLLARVAQLQTQPPEQIAELIESQRSKRSILARRGNLVDRQRRLIATTGVAWRLYVDPKLIKDPGTFSEHVAYNLDYDPAMIEQKLFERRNTRYVVIDKRMTEEKFAKFQGMKASSEHRAKMYGLNTEMWLERRYPQGKLAGQIVGFVGRDGDGLAGAEKLFEQDLLGTPGSMRYIRDARHRPLWISSADYHRPVDGNVVRTSVDMKIQEIVEQELAKTCAEFGAESGQVIVMNPHTGEILAMANHPTFDPTKFGQTPAKMRRNRCVTDSFEPGSAFKPFVWAALTDAGFGKRGEMIDCHSSGVWFISRSRYKRKLRDAYPVGRVTWEKVLIKSSNIGMAKVADRAGNQKLYAAIRKFGFGSTTNSGLIGEVPGLVNPLKKWTRYSLHSIPMGQEVGVTGLQMARATAIIANGGLNVVPTLRAVDRSQERVPVFERIMSEKTCDYTRQVMRRVVTEGTGRKLKDAKYPIFGKTGTAQVARTDGRGYEPNAYTACFVGGAPAKTPRIVVTCFIHRPDPAKGYYGGVVAGPCTKRIIERTLEYMGVPSDEERDDRSRARLANG